VNPPLIDTASDELVLTASDNITITCFGDLPLNWTYPENRVTVCVFCHSRKHYCLTLSVIPI